MNQNGRIIVLRLAERNGSGTASVEKHQIRNRKRVHTLQIVDSEATDSIPMSWLKDPLKRLAALSGTTEIFYSSPFSLAQITPQPLF